MIGAHYDHLGYRGGGTGAAREVYCGADDNASGTSAVLLLAERFGKLARTKDGLPSDRRSLLLVAFTGEERGLLGSRYLVAHLEQMGLKTGQIAAMLNLDMVGRLRSDRVMVAGVGSGDRWEPLLEAARGDSGLSLLKSASGFGPSDHSSFYRVGIPVLFFDSGMHPDVHTPRNTADKINCQGAVKIANLVDAVARQLWTDPRRISYAAPKPGQDGSRSGARLGIMPELAEGDGKGVLVVEVLPDSPAAKAGVRGGDLIVKWEGAAISSLPDLLRALAARKPGDKVRLTVRRGDRPVDLEVTLGGR